ncbi:MAG: restriction endonuclease subunit R [Flavobacteriales endosymbiont of Rhyzopertha dominica]|nr:MAG: type I restriction enzyme HsdR N-terminal domain-containing protein [Candidatus Shikimatogenerans bostrichidophilus]
MININKYKIKLYKSLFNNYKNIFCIKRKKFIIYSEEELLRQKILLFLINKKKYKLYNIKIEKKIFLNYNKYYKIDILVNNNILIECKSPKFKINKINFYQLFKYSNFLKINYLFLTNGIENIIFKINLLNNKIKYVKDIPNNINKHIFY